MSGVRFCACIALSVCSVLTAVAVDIEITKTGAAKINIDVSDFRHGISKQEKLFYATLCNDLERWGWFRIHKQSAIRLLGSCQAQGESLVIEANVVNRADGKSYLQRNYNDNVSFARKLAHRLADELVQELKGRRGVASTRIAMIGEINGRKDLYVCDVDGQKLIQLTRDGTPCLSPGWNPSAARIYYTSFHRGFPDVYAVDVAGGKRLQASKQPGVNAGPAISPDGKQMALTLSRDGNPELYVMNLRSGHLQRLTTTRQAAEASPSWSPDGMHIVYVSDKSGSPKLYVVSRRGGQSQRLIRQRGESVSPNWGADGRIVYSGKRDGNYHICMMDGRGGREEQLTDGGADHEEPSWAPNGRHIVYSKTVGYSMNLYILDTLGDPEIRLTTFKGDWYSPSWSPR